MDNNFYLSLIPGAMGACTPYDFKDKEKCVANHIKYMLSRTQSMFEYEGLPSTITKRNLELMEQVNGFVCIAQAEGNLYAFYGGLGGEPDPYYMPTQCIVANPSLKFNKTLKIDEECIIIPNDPLYQGLIPMFSRYATGLMENELSMWIASIMLRVHAVISADDDTTKESAEEYLRKVFGGDLGVIGGSAFMEGVKTQPYGNTQNNTLLQLIEHEQYLKGSWYNDIGLQSAFNMKREAINSAESELNDDVLFPLINEMLECRQKGWDKVNDLFGTSVTVKLSSSWLDNEEEKEAELELKEHEADPEPEPEPDPEPEEKEGETDDEENT